MTVLPTLEEYEETYNRVFDSKDRIKACGRANTSKLITISKRMDIDREYDSFGDELTGVMNVANITALHRKLVR